MEIKKPYRKIRPEIEKRLSQFLKDYEAGDDDYVFHELAFCILTPQSKAKMCWACIDHFKSEGGLHSFTVPNIEKNLKGVRFKYKKAEYIAEVRDKLLKTGGFSLKKHIESFNDVYKLREWLVKNVKGYGYKEASHFLRNIGKGGKLAILDRHILRNLAAMDVISEIPASISARMYIGIENKMKPLSESINIPMDHLDMLLWYRETGELFK